MGAGSVARIVVVGCGTVGTAIGKGFRSRDHDVRFVDTDPVRVEVLRAQGLPASTEVDLGGKPSIVFLAVPTPVQDGRFELGPLLRAAGSVARALHDGTAPCTAVVRSTVPPGTCDGVIRPVVEEVSGRRCGDRLSLASSPEFLREATALEDFLAPRVTVIGSRERAASDRLVDLFSPFGGEIVVTHDPTLAEMIKCVHNAFNATKISFWNEMWTLSRALGVDADLVAKTVAMSAEASYNPSYGIRGGSPYIGCLDKDIEGLRGLSEAVGVPVPLLEAVITVNAALGAAVQPTS